jgi:heat shock protein HslJ
MARTSKTADGEQKTRLEPGRAQSSNGRARKLNGATAAALAREQLEQLTGHPIEAITGLTRREDGWTVMAEVVELQRVPPTTDILATYRIELDEDGDLMGYERVNRYYRNQAGGES